jgi:hypothetical protein
MTETESWSDHVLTLSEDQLFLGDLAQIKARALLKEISAETDEAPNWKYNITTVLRNLTAALFELQALAKEGKYSIERMSWATRQFALAWESLAKLAEVMHVHQH